MQKLALLFENFTRTAHFLKSVAIKSLRIISAMLQRKWTACKDPFGMSVFIFHRIYSNQAFLSESLDNTALQISRQFGKTFFRSWFSSTCRMKTNKAISLKFSKTVSNIPVLYCANYHLDMLNSFWIIEHNRVVHFFGPSNMYFSFKFGL